MVLPTVQPMEPVPLEQPFDDTAWVYQVKWDGIRLLSCIENGENRLYTRRGQDRTDNYPELAGSALVNVQSAILDGEVLALNSKGVPSFPRIMRRHLGGRGGKRSTGIQIQYVVFDLLYLNGRWLVERPLAERQALLGDVVNHTGTVHLCDNHSSGLELFEATGRLGLEGIVAKELGGHYHLGRKHRTWRKIKHFKELDVAVAAVTIKQGRANALLVMAYADGKPTYVGRVATGLNTEQLRLFTELATRAEAPRTHLENSAQIPRGLDIRWLSTYPVVRVRFLEWTEQGVMRGPVIQGFSRCAESECILE